MRSMIWRRRLEEEVKKKIKSMQEEEMKQTICQLQKNHVLEAEYREILSEKSAENERILDEKIEDLKIRMEAELKEKRRAEAYCVKNEENYEVFYEGLEDVQLFQSVHLTDNIDMLSTPWSPWQNQGKNTAGVAYSSEPGTSVNHDVENSDGKSKVGMTCTSACKRKRSIKKCEELGKKIQRSAGVVDDKWK